MWWQREYKNPMPGGRSITIDIYAVDGNDKIYDIEVQGALYIMSIEQ